MVSTPKQAQGTGAVGVTGAPPGAPAQPTTPTTPMMPAPAPANAAGITAALGPGVQAGTGADKGPVWSNAGLQVLDQQAMMRKMLADAMLAERRRGMAVMEKGGRTYLRPRSGGGWRPEGPTTNPNFAGGGRGLDMSGTPVTTRMK